MYQRRSTCLARPRGCSSSLALRRKWPAEQRIAVAASSSVSHIEGSGTGTLLQSLESRLGITGEDAINQATGLLNAGLSPSVLTSILERAGDAGGPELLDLLFAVRDQVDLASGGEAIGSVIGALNRRGPDGRLDESLRQIGVTDDQGLVQRLGTIGQAFASGEITEGQFQQALGGAEGLRLGPAFAREVAAGLEDDRAERLAITAAGQISNILGSRYVRGAEGLAAEGFRQQLALENSRLAALNEAEQTFFGRLAEQGGGNAAIGFIAPGVALEPEERERQRSQAELIRTQSLLRRQGVALEQEFDFDLPLPGAGGPVVNNFFNGPVINGIGADPEIGDIEAQEAR